jgi:hypothetical protein
MRLLRIVGPVLVLALIATVYWLPTLIHAMDHGWATVTLADLEAGKLPEGTHNLNITLAQPGATFVTLDERKNGRSVGGTKMYVPLRQAGESDSGKVKVLVLDDYSNYSDYTGIAPTDEGLLGMRGGKEPPTEFKGVLRNVLWEGLDKADEVSTHLLKGGIFLENDPLVLDATGDSRSTFALITIVGAALVGLFIGLSIDKEARKKKAAQTVGGVPGRPIS